MKLTDLNAQFVGAGGEGVTNADGSPVPERSGVGVMLDCPCGCDQKLFVAFTNPIDGSTPFEDPHPRPRWQRTGETIETLTLTPSIRRVPVNGQGCEWHGWITNGETVNA